MEDQWSYIDGYGVKAIMVLAATATRLARASYLTEGDKSPPS